MIATDTTKPRRAGIGNVRLDRLPPHSTEAEQGALGCCLIEPRVSVGMCVEALKAGGEEFYDLRHQTIYSALLGMFKDNEQVDLITLQQRLKDQQLLEQVGGLTYLAQLPDAAPSAANLPEYLGILRDKHALRRMLQACTETVAMIYQDEGAVEETLDEAERMVMEVRGLRGELVEQTPRALVAAALNRIEDTWARKGALGGLATGFADWDRMTDGLHAGEVTVISALPKKGKTALAMNVAEHVLLALHRPVGVFTLEMPAVDLVTRTLCSSARVNLRNLREGFLSERDFPKLTGAASRLSAAKMRFDDQPGLTAMQFRAKARRMRAEHKVELVVLDYMQLMTAPDGSKRGESQEQEFARISRVVKLTARELGIPILAMSQVNEQGATRGSRAFEQDADAVMRLEPDCDEDRESEEAVPYNLNIRMQRNGPSGKVPLVFLKSYTRFESAAKVSDRDVPN